MEKMDLFNDAELDIPTVELPENPTNAEVLDFIMLTLLNGIQECKMAFKGGYLLNKILSDKSRFTHDIDFSIEFSEDYGKIKKVLYDMGEFLIKKGVAASYILKEDIGPTRSGGIVIELKTKITNKKNKVGVDVGLHPLNLGTVSYNLDVGDICGFSVERMLSDKLQVIHSQKRFRRTKDLYDVFILINNFKVNFNLLYDCILMRGEIDWDKTPKREDILVEYVKAWKKLEIQNPFNGLTIATPELDRILQLFSVFTEPFVYRDGVMNIIWNNNNLCWEDIE